MRQYWVGRDPTDIEGLRRDLWPRVFPIPPQALATIDIALWDLAGKVSGEPLFRLMGAERERIRSYASTPMLDDIPAYLDFVEALLGQGFTAVKFHTWCIPEDDAALARAMRQRYPDKSVEFMLDAENNYNRESAVRVAKELEELDFTWFEAPLPDYDLEGYRMLAREVEMPVLPSGNWIMDLGDLRGGGEVGVLEVGEDGCAGDGRGHAVAEGGGNKSGGGDELRDHVVGVQPELDGEPTHDAGDGQLHLFRAGRCRTSPTSTGCWTW